MDSVDKPLCRHCKRNKLTKPRGLCFTCYHTPGVRELYPSHSKYARLGIGLGCKPSRKPAKPTLHPPGTPEKLAVMETRAGRNESLFHPKDARELDVPPGAATAMGYRPSLTRPDRLGVGDSDSRLDTAE